MCIYDRCEGYDSDRLTVEDVFLQFGKDEADFYEQWIYFNLK